jgi:hypothetical protein
VVANCYKLKGKFQTKNKAQRKVNKISARECYTCDSTSHIAIRCNHNKGARKPFKTQRVCLVAPDQSTCLIEANILKFDNLLKATGVSAKAQNVEFKQINVMTDSRGNADSGMPGFISVLERESLFIGDKLVGGGTTSQHIELERAEGDAVALQENDGDEVVFEEHGLLGKRREVLAVDI